MRSTLATLFLLAVPSSLSLACATAEPIAPVPYSEGTPELWQPVVGESGPREIDDHVHFRWSRDRRLEGRIVPSPGPFGAFELVYAFDDPERPGAELVFLLDERKRYLWGPGFRDATSPHARRWTVGQTTEDDVHRAMADVPRAPTEHFLAGTGDHVLEYPVESDRTLVFWFDRDDRLAGTPYVGDGRGLFR